MSFDTRGSRQYGLEELRRLTMLVEYDGTGYHGFQAQDNAQSVQETLEAAICSLTGEHLRIKGAGRTDAGVHAQGQVVAFDTWASHAPEVFIKRDSRHNLTSSKALWTHTTISIVSSEAFGTSFRGPGSPAPRGLSLTIVISSKFNTFSGVAGTLAAHHGL